MEPGEQEILGDDEFVFLAVMLFNESPDAMVVVDEAGTIRHINNQAELLFGYHRSELKGLSVEVLVPDAVRSQHEAYRTKYADEPRRRAMGSGMELKAKRKSGLEIPVEINLSPVSTPKGMRVIATIRKKRAS